MSRWPDHMPFYNEAATALDTEAQPVPRTTMQIDFHHAATYAIARIAGFAHDAASDQRYDVLKKILPAAGIHAA